MNDKPFVKLAWSSLWRGVAGLRSDISQQREEFLLGCANSVGNRTGNWCYELARAILLAANHPTQDLPLHDLEGANDFELLRPSGGEVPLWSESSRAFDWEDSRSPQRPSHRGDQSPVEDSLTELMLREFLSWLLQRHAAGWSWLAAPVAATAVGWLLRKFRIPRKKWIETPSTNGPLLGSSESDD